MILVKSALIDHLLFITIVVEFFCPYLVILSIFCTDGFLSCDAPMLWTIKFYLFYSYLKFNSTIMKCSCVTHRLLFEVLQMFSGMKYVNCELGPNGSYPWITLLPVIIAHLLWVKPWKHIMNWVSIFLYNEIPSFVMILFFLP